MTKKAFQDYYPEETSYCYGCGRNNDAGLHLKSYWDESGEESIATFTPRTVIDSGDRYFSCYLMDQYFTPKGNTHDNFYNFTSRNIFVIWVLWPASVKLFTVIVRIFYAKRSENRTSDLASAK